MQHTADRAKGDLSRTALRARDLQRLAAACAVFFTIVASASAAEPLARCGLTMLSAPAASGTYTIVNGVVTQPSAENPISYRRGPAGDWLVPAQVDAKNPAIDAFLLVPGRPLHVRIEALVEGRSFRALSEEWIDRALAQPRRETGEKKPSTNKEEEHAGGAADRKPSAEPKTDKPAQAGEPPENATQPAAATPDQAMMQNLTAYQKADVPTWLTDYVRDSTTPVERNEARWLIAQRAGGPALMELERFSLARSAAAPMVQFLDRDGDGTLSAGEVGQAVARLAESDFNQDSAVELAEVERARPAGGSGYHTWRTEPLLIVVDEQTDFGELARVVQSCYAAKGGKGAEMLDAAALERLYKAPPELSLRIRYGATKEETGVELLAVDAARFGDEKPRATENVIAVASPSYEVELVAGQTGEMSGGGQIALGAVVEGAPLWSLADLDNDGRLSQRELHDVPALLADLDANHDGALTADEIPVRIRIGVSLGPQVHTLLAQRMPPVPRAPRTPREKAPDWFASMDTNGDGDLNSREFVGTAEQFAALDRNGDGLISVKEATDSGDPPQK